jgi:hypothetical protein
MAWLERRPADLVAGVSALSALKIQEDPEAIFQEGWLLCELGEYDAGLDHLRRAVAKGYFVAPTLTGSPHFAALGGDPRFQEMLAEAKAGRTRALQAFRNAGGEDLLGVR